MKNIRLIATLFLIPTLAHAFTPTYTVKVLPQTLSGYSDVDITGMDLRGDFAGVALGDEWDAAVLVHQGVITNIAPVPSGNNSYSNAINSLGVVTGELGNNTTNPYRGFIYDHGKLTTFEPPGAFVCATTAINDFGQIVGNFSPRGTSITNGLNENDHVFLRQPNGTFEDFGNFGSDPYPLINDQGVIVITALNSSATSGFSYSQAFVRQPGSAKLKQIPAQGLGTEVSAACINQLGQIAGTLAIDSLNSVNRGFIYYNGHVTVLGVFPSVGASPGPLNSSAENINDLGQVVGSSSQEPLNTSDPSDPEKTTFNPGFSHGFVYFKGAMHDLNTLLSAAPSGLVITDAFFINDLGQILAVGTIQGQQGQKNLLLTPNAILP
jgi:uncharacterized membrane protein